MTEGDDVTKSYVFLAEVLQEEDGRWSAGVPGSQLLRRQIG